MATQEPERFRRRSAIYSTRTITTDSLKLKGGLIYILTFGVKKAENRSILPFRWMNGALVLRLCPQLIVLKRIKKEGTLNVDSRALS